MEMDTEKDTVVRCGGVTHRFSWVSVAAFHLLCVVLCLPYAAMTKNKKKADEMRVLRRITGTTPGCREGRMRASPVVQYRNPFWRNKVRTTQGISEGWDRAVAK